jgi:O-antigen ligase
VLTVVGALVVVLALALGLRRSLSEEQRRRAGRWLVVTAAVALLAAAVAGSVAAADAVTSGRDCTEVVNDPSRFKSLANNRLCWWREAWDVYAHNSPVGAGAGTFEIARKRFRSDARTVVQPHSVPLQQLADGGIPALALFVALVLSGIAVCVCALRRLRGAERAAGAALVAAPAAYLCHSLVDYSWDFVAVTAPTMVVLGVLAGAGRVEGARRRRRPLVALAAVLLAATVLVSFSFPRLADSAERSSTRALAAGDFARALDEANRARFFDPVSVDPLYARARISEARRVPWKAERDYVKAVELQPDNPETWYTLGIFEFDVRGNLCAAYRFLNNAYTLDPSGSQWRPGGPLDVSRAAVNRGGCAAGS